MKKILLAIIFLSVIIFVAPAPVFGAANMEVTVTITSFQIPERAAYLLYEDPSNTEFGIEKSRITVVRNRDNLVVGSMDFAPLGRMAKNASVVIPFSYIANDAPYNIHAEIRVESTPAGYTAAKADCSLVVLSSSEWYKTYTTLKNNVWQETSFCLNAGNYGNYLAVPASSVILGGSFYYWRSPVLFTIY